jgi:arylsulfatase
MLRLSVAALICALAAACRQAPEGRQLGRGVLVVAIDGLRADHVGCYGYDRDTTPNLDALAKEGVRFEQAFSTSPWFLPAHISLMTGCDPGVARRNLAKGIQPTIVGTWRIPPYVPHLAKEFLSRGYATGAFFDQAWLTPGHGFGPGFETLQACPKTWRRISDVGVRGGGDRFTQWLREKPKDRNWFAYLHLHDLERCWGSFQPQWDTFFEPRPELSSGVPIGEADHVFFAVPRLRWEGRRMHSLGEYEAHYDGAVRRVDHLLGRLFTELRQQNRYDNTTIVVVGTCGLGFGEAGLILDSGTMSDVDLRVPLILRPAQQQEALRNQASPALASILDVPPTLLELEGMGRGRGMHGLSLASVVRGGGRGQRAYTLASYGLREGSVLIDERYCLEVTYPARTRFPSLVSSWFGKVDKPANLDVEWVALHDRLTDTSLGHRRGTGDDPHLLARLRAQMNEWVARVDLARERLQSPNLFVDRSAIEELLAIPGARLPEVDD